MAIGLPDVLALAGLALLGYGLNTWSPGLGWAVVGAAALWVALRLARRTARASKEGS